MEAVVQKRKEKLQEREEMQKTDKSVDRDKKRSKRWTFSSFSCPFLLLQPFFWPPLWTAIKRMSSQRSYQSRRKLWLDPPMTLLA